MFYGREWTHDHWRQAFPTAQAVEVKGERLRLLHALLGIMDEAGELIDWLGKSPIGTTRQDGYEAVNLIEEFGDLIWYLTLGLDSIGITLEQLIDINEAKLRKRYPEGHFTEGRAVNRDRDGEREVLAESICSSAGS